jgi:tetratricopeptide (TPR) repeat protein
VGIAPRMRITMLRHRERYGGEHTKAVGLAVLAIVAFLLEGTAAAQDMDRQWNSCVLYDEHGKLRSGASPDLTVGACTAIIQSGQETTKGLARAFNNRGIAYRDTREYDRAIQDLDEAIRLDPNYARAFGNRGIAYGRKGQDDLALQDFDQAIRLDPNDARAFYNRGNT